LRERQPAATTPPVASRPATQKWQTAKGCLVAVGVLAAFCAWSWYDNASKHRWAERVRQRLGAKGFVLIDTETLGDLVNPFSWTDPPVATLCFCAPDMSEGRLRVLPTGVIQCLVAQVVTHDFEGEKETRYLFLLDPQTGLIKVKLASAEGTIESESGYEEPKGWMKRIADWMRRHASAGAAGPGEATREALREPGGQTGEFGPHLRPPQFEFVASYGQDFVYIRPSDTGRLAGNKFVVGVFIFREQSGELVIDSASGKAALPPKNASADKEGRLDFIAPPAGTPLANMLARLKRPDTAEAGDREGRNGRRWLYAGLDADLWAFYVCRHEERKPEGGLVFRRFLLLKEQGCTLYIDPNRRMFAPVDTDLMGFPEKGRDGLRYRPMRDGEMECKVWDAIKDRLPPE